MDEKKTSSERQTVPESDPLAPLHVIDRLEVGPVRVESDRLIAPYSVTQGEKKDTVDLIYRYEERVFDPHDPACRNLGAMIGAQVALNYGLFCREIAFLGPYDGRDRRFLEEFAENTAREIYVNKFLKPNPFLLGPAARLPPVRRDRYLRASLAFPDPGPPIDGLALWSADPARHAVLSSGGKDSLLTFGLLQDLGQQVEAVFLNESGRHWYTALNAYRHLVVTYPGTARVWTNSDRVFAWMLRRLPFVRQDFSRVRADIYPIRLWTVAVFLFGALPILRKRGTGRLLIGDEFDTSVPATHEGIPHYDGLYDQSVWFDGAMTRYFGAKGWGLTQFSALRPLSELLIEKILLERYPELQRHQLSCHAAAVRGDRVYPCGKCEKCRRIVGMLVALGGNPASCGYSAQQVGWILGRLSEGGIHQGPDDAEHLLHLLQNRGVALPGVCARAHPEVMGLRFDPDRSPVEVVPQDLRGPLYRLLLEHVEGAAIREGDRWVPLDVTDPAAPCPQRSRPGSRRRQFQDTF